MFRHVRAEKWENIECNESNPLRSIDSVASSFESSQRASADDRSSRTYYNPRDDCKSSYVRKRTKELRSVIFFRLTARTVSATRIRLSRDISPLELNAHHQKRMTSLMDPYKTVRRE